MTSPIPSVRLMIRLLIIEPPLPREQLPRLCIFNEIGAGRQREDNQAVIAVEKAEPYKILADEAPERIQNKLPEAGAFALLELNLSHHGRKFLDLVDMLIDRIVGIMQQIAGDMLWGAVVVQQVPFVDSVTAPRTFPFVKQAQFAVRIPSAMADPGAAIIGQPVETIPVVLPVALDFEDRFS